MRVSFGPNHTKRQSQEDMKQQSTSDPAHCFNYRKDISYNSLSSFEFWISTEL
jgi:hypothetical protein